MPEPRLVLPNYLLDDRVLLRVNEAATRLGVSLATVKRLLASGDLRSVKIGSSRRVPVADLADYVDRLRDQAYASQGGPR